MVARECEDVLVAELWTTKCLRKERGERRVLLRSYWPNPLHFSEKPWWFRNYISMLLLPSCQHNADGAAPGKAFSPYSEHAQRHRKRGPTNNLVVPKDPVSIGSNRRTWGRRLRVEGLHPNHPLLDISHPKLRTVSNHSSYTNERWVGRSKRSNKYDCARYGTSRCCIPDGCFCPWVAFALSAVFLSGIQFGRQMREAEKGGKMLLARSASIHKSRPIESLDRPYNTVSGRGALFLSEHKC